MKNNHGLYTLLFKIFFMSCLLPGQPQAQQSPLPDSTHWPIKSSTNVTFHGANLGPAIEFSSMLLKTGELFQYICRNGDRNGTENGERESQLCRMEGGTCEVVGSVNTSRQCPGDTNNQSQCVINDGELSWARDKGGVYSCSAHSSEKFAVLWYSGVVTVPGNRNLGADSYGQPLSFYCGMDMTPKNINYADIMSVQWQQRSDGNGNDWSVVQPSGDFRFIVPSTGSNYTLSIPKYNPIKHGGEYRCTVKINNDKAQQRSSFIVTSKGKAAWGNNKRPFDRGFDIDEPVVFTCNVWMYPFPDKIEMWVDNKKLQSHTEGLVDYEVDKIGTDQIKNHFGRIAVSNMSAIFTNGSLLECRVFKGSSEEAVDRKRIYLKEGPTPKEVTTMTSNPQAKRRDEKMKTWMIAIAVIIPIAVLLDITIFIIVLIKTKSCKNGDRGDYSLGDTDDPDATKELNL